MTEKMPSSVRFGSRPSRWVMRSYSSGVNPCARIRSAVPGSFIVGKPCGVETMEREIESSRRFRQLRESVGQRTEDDPPIGAAEQFLACPLRMRHQPQHV